LQATATFEEISSPRPDVSAESLHELPACVDRMLAERNRLIGEFEHFRREVALQQSLIQKYGQGDSGVLDFRLPLRDLLAAQHGDLIQQLDDALRGMEAADQALRQSRETQMAIQADCDAIETKRRRQRNLGWCLALIFVGIFLILAANEMRSDVDQKRRELEEEQGRAEDFVRELPTVYLMLLRGDPWVGALRQIPVSASAPEFQGISGCVVSWIRLMKTYLAVRKMADDAGLPLVSAMEDYLRARKMAGTESLASMAAEYSKHFGNVTRRATVPEVVAQILASRKQDGSGKRHLAQLRSVLRILMLRLFNPHANGAFPRLTAD